MTSERSASSLREAAGVADDVGITRAQPEDVLDGEPRVHAGEDSQLAAGRQGQLRAVELRDVALVLR